MAFHLRKINKNNDIYLYIYETFRDKNSTNPRQKHYKTLGFVSKLKEDGISDPIEYALNEVSKLNLEQKIRKETEKSEKISKNGILHFGNFIINKLIKKLNYSDTLDLLNYDNELSFSPSNLLNDLVISRIISPASKSKTFNEIFNTIIDINYDSNIKNLYQGLSFFGKNYKKIIQLLNEKINKKYKRNTSSVFFDCTNFYFEINREDELRKKGPSKENKKSPLVSMGLMLDNDLIPIGMNIFPGNESEKPQLKKVIKEMKEQDNINGKTILVADKGLNCAKNIIEATNNGDGYIFSKSIKTLKQEKQNKIIDILKNYKIINFNNNFFGSFFEEIIENEYSYKDENGKKISKKIIEKHIYSYSASFSKKQTHEIDKKLEKAININLSTFKKENFSTASTYIKSNSELDLEVDYEKASRDKLMSGITIIITSEIEVDSNIICNKYSQLWRIEESFKILKSELDTRPIFHHKDNNIKGHLLICYLALTFLRILEFKEFNYKYSSSQLVNIIRKFKCFKIKNQYLNLTTEEDFIEFFNKKYNINLNQLYIKNTTMKKILS